ncbi:MAG: hypothetical protein AAFO79_11720, partial [Pseudomonadota bacterium]
MVAQFWAAPGVCLSAMLRAVCAIAFATIVIAACIAVQTVPVSAQGREPIGFAGPWSIFPGNGATGAVISTSAFAPDRHTPLVKLDAARPVGAALLSAGLLPDPYRGTGLFNWPGAYANQRVRGDKLDFAPVTDAQRRANPWLKSRRNPFAQPWWYRRKFTLPAGLAADRTRQFWLDIEAMNYTATIWLNGQAVYGPVSGPYRRHPVRLPAELLRAGVNILAVEVRHPGREELGHSWIDWIATPPDKMQGVRREPELFATGAARLRNTLLLTQSVGEAGARIEFATTVKARAAGRVA